MNKIKLPRKRKKACIRAIGKANYLGCLYLNEILGKNNFPDLKAINGNIKFIKNW